MKTKSLVALSFFVALSAFASQPLRRAVQLPLADGTMITVERRGGPEMSWWETADGHRYNYSEAHQLVPFTAADEACLREVSLGGYLPFTATTQGSCRTGLHHSMVASTADGLGSFGVSGEGVVKSIGSPTIPVIMVAFADLDFLPANDRTKIDRFLNEEGYKDEQYAIGSVADYFNHSSKGHFKPHFEVVAKVTLPNGYKYYGGKSGSSADARRSEAIREAVRLAEAQGVDFSKYSSDGHSPLISVLHAGPGEQEDFGKDYEDYFWAHFSQTSISAGTTTFDSYLLTNETMRDFDDAYNVTNEHMTGIGTFCHELGHALGLPDLYDVNGTTNGKGNTPGYWDIMDYQFMYDGFRPMEYSAYERSMMGWLDVKRISKSARNGVYDLAPLGTAKKGENEAYRIVNPANDKEYFLLENRQKSTFYMDNMLGSGMLVWRINYDSNLWSGNRVNIDANHQRVCVVPADGAWQDNADLNLRDAENKRYTFTGDLFPGYANVTSFDAELCNFGTGRFEGTVSNIEVQNGTNHVTFTYADPTLITSIETFSTQNGAPLYDLQGRCVQSAEIPAGMYILGGRIVIRK